MSTTIYSFHWVFFVLVLGSLGFFLVSTAHAAESTDSGGYVLQIQLTPAQCLINASKQKQRKCLEGYALTIKGLLPEQQRDDCITDSSAKLSPLQERVVARVMPDENARYALWKNIGGCIDSNASHYFRSIIHYAERLKIPTQLTDGADKVADKTSLKNQFVRLNDNLTPSGIRLYCQNQKQSIFLVQVDVCYSKKGEFKKCEYQTATTCPESFQIKGNY